MKRLLLVSFIFSRDLASLLLSCSVTTNDLGQAFAFQNSHVASSFYRTRKGTGRRVDLTLSSFLPFQRRKELPNNGVEVFSENTEQEFINKKPKSSSKAIPVNESVLLLSNNDGLDHVISDDNNVQRMINNFNALKGKEGRLSGIDSLRATIARVPSLHQYIIDWDLPVRKFFSESNQTLPLSITYMDALRQQMEDFINEISAALPLLQSDLYEEETNDGPNDERIVVNGANSSSDGRSLSLLDGPFPGVTYPYNIPYVTDFISYLSKFFTASGYLPALNSSVVNTPIETFFDAYAFTKIQSSDPIFSIKASEMARLAGDIYEDALLEGTLNDLGHTVVVNGTSADVVWMITDSVDSMTSRKPMLVRTVTIRGYSAVDARVDRVRLLQKVCSATPAPIGSKKYGVVAHSGLLEIAKEIYRDIRPYILGLGKHHKLIFNGHSIGGSISVLLLLLLTVEHGVDFIRNYVRHVFTFGSPPVVASAVNKEFPHPNSKCDILDTFGLPVDIIKGYAQPWDPILRLFSHVDPLYPLIDDIGEDGKTLWANGPPRTLRPLLKAIFETWEDWPSVRDISRASVNQNYTHIGLSHLFLPDPARYLTDRMISMNIAAPPIKSIIQLQSSRDILPLLTRTFPLDVFGISYVSTAVRSFLHHFHPSYSIPFVEFQDKPYILQEESDSVQGANNILSFKWAKSAASWVLGGIGYRRSKIE